MKTFYTKCGREFKKSSNAVVTGYEYPENDDKCKSCLFAEKDQRYRGGQLVEIKECQAGERRPNHDTTQTVNFDDFTNMNIYTLNISLLESITSFTKEIEGVETCYFNSIDQGDCRKSFTICFTKNKKGKAAKRAIVDKFFSNPTEIFNEKAKGLGVSDETLIRFEALKEKAAQQNSLSIINPPQKGLEVLIDKEAKLNNYISDIKGKSQKIVLDYIKIGISLTRINNENLYEIKGYSNLIDFAKGELNFSKTLLYNTMAIAEKFGNTAEATDPEEGFLVKPEYKDFSLSQLTEMVSLPEEKVNSIKPEMTVKEIRQVKHEDKKGFEVYIIEALRLNHFLEKQPFNKQFDDTWAGIYTKDIKDYIYLLDIKADKNFKNIEFIVTARKDGTLDWKEVSRNQARKDGFDALMEVTRQNLISYPVDKMFSEKGFEIDCELYYSNSSDSWYGEYSKYSYTVEITCNSEFNSVRCDIYPTEGITGDEDERYKEIESVNVMDALEKADEYITGISNGTELIVSSELDIIPEEAGPVLNISEEKGNETREKPAMNNYEVIRNLDLVHDLIEEAKEILWSIPKEKLHQREHDTDIYTPQGCISRMIDIMHGLSYMRPVTKNIGSYEKHEENQYMKSENWLRPAVIRKKLLEVELKKKEIGTKEHSEITAKIYAINQYLEFNKNFLKKLIQFNDTDISGCESYFDSPVNAEYAAAAISNEAMFLMDALGIDKKDNQK